MLDVAPPFTGGELRNPSAVNVDATIFIPGLQI